MFAVERLQISEAGPEDAGEVIELWRATGLTRPWNDPQLDFDQASQGPTSAVLLGRAADGEAVAAAMVGFDGHRGWIYYFCVHPHVRSQGLGAQLLTESERWLADHGARKIQLMVREGNDADGFYARHGYTDQQTTVLGRWLKD